MMTARVFARVKHFFYESTIWLTPFRQSLVFCLVFLQVSRLFFYVNFANTVDLFLLAKLWLRGLQFDLMMISYCLVPYWLFLVFRKPHVKLSNFLLYCVCALETVDQLAYYLYGRGIYILVFADWNEYGLLKSMLLILIAAAFYKTFFLAPKIKKYVRKYTLATTVIAFVLLALGTRGSVTPLPLTELPQISTKPRLHRISIDGAYIFTWHLERKSAGLGVSPKLEPAPAQMEN